MASFDIATDVKIYVKQYPANTFILGLSTLGGPDLLSDASATWVEMECDVLDLEWTRGSSTNLGILTVPEPATARMSLQTIDQDPISNRQMRVGAEIRVDIIDASSTAVRVFTGRIDTLFSTYDPDGSMVMEIYAMDAYKELVNTPYQTSGLAPQPIANVLTFAMGQVGLTASASSDVNGTIVTHFFNDTDYKTIGEVVGWLMDAEQGWLQLTPDGTEYTFLNRSHAASAIAAGADFTASNIHSSDPSHLCLTDVQLQFDNFDQANIVNAVISDGVTTGTVSNQDSIEMFGASQADVELPGIISVFFLDPWLDAIVNKMGNKLVRQVTVNGLTTDGTLTDILAIDQGDAIRTEFTRNGSTIDETSIVARITHSLTIGAWDAKIEIWKGN